FRDGHHSAGRLMTLVLLWAGTGGCPIKVGGRGSSVRVPSGSPAVHAAKPPGIAIHRPGCLCRKAAGDSHPPQAARVATFARCHLRKPVIIFEPTTRVCGLADTWRVAELAASPRCARKSGSALEKVAPAVKREARGGLARQQSRRA